MTEVEEPNRAAYRYSSKNEQNGNFREAWVPYTRNLPTIVPHRPASSSQDPAHDKESHPGEKSIAHPASSPRDPSLEPG
jgi:hypothetical protein